MRKRVRVEFQDDDGTKYTLAVEGRLSREKVLKVMDLMELVEGDGAIVGQAPDNSTVYGKVREIIDSAYAAKEFSTADIARHYEELHNTTTNLSTISTYLSRMAEKGYLKRQKFGNSWVFKKSYVIQNQVPER